MKKVASLMIVLVMTSMLFAFEVVPGYTKGAGEASMKTFRKPTGSVPYTPAMYRQDVLFVEDCGDSGFGPATKPDPTWDYSLTTVLGAGNFGWYGPIYFHDEDGPDLTTMQGYSAVIWNTYDNWFDTPNAVLTANDQTNIASYISGGGHFWFIAQDAIYSGVPPAWLGTNFHLDSYTEDVNDTSFANVIGTDEINGITCLFTCDYVWNPFFADELVPDASAHQLLLDSDNGYNYAIMSDDFSSSFWAIDGRTPDPGCNWRLMINEVLTAFGITTAIEENNIERPEPFSFKSATINNGRAVITFTLESPTKVDLSIYDALGRLNATVVSKQFSAGTHTLSTKLDFPTGVYFYNLKTESGVNFSEKFLFVK